MLVPLTYCFTLARKGVRNKQGPCHFRCMKVNISVVSVLHPVCLSDQNIKKILIA